MQLEDRLQRQIIVADTIMYQAILTFINQDLASYVKGEHHYTLPSAVYQPFSYYSQSMLFIQ